MMTASTASPNFTRTIDQSEDAGTRSTINAPFGSALVQVASERTDIVGLTADLGKYTDIFPFRDAFPERFFNIGMAEQNLIAVAAGLARTGYTPFATTYGVFASRRAYDFIAIACAHAGMDVKIIAGLPGLTTGYGGTHQAIEDLAIMTAVPGLVVVDPCDAIEIAAATRKIAEYRGAVYMRLLRGSVPVVLDSNYEFEIGKARQLRAGKDIGFVSTGMMTERTLDAADALAAQGVQAGVLHVSTLKPFDADTVASFCSEVGSVISVENHVVRGGLASLVAEALFDRRVDKQLTRVGLADRFVECGSVATLQRRSGLTAPQLVATAMEVLR
jgi:transketolase